MLKRFSDIFISLLAIVVLSPIAAVVALKIKKCMGAPVIFRQIRPGRDGRPFEMIKFRTMCNAFDDFGNPLPDDQRMTPFGIFFTLYKLG